VAISKYAHEVLNRPDLIAKRDTWYKRMENIFNSTPDAWNDENVLLLKGMVAHSSVNALEEPEKWVEDCLEDLAHRVDEADTDLYFCPMCLQFDLYGVHYLDKMFGAEVFFQDGQWYNRYLETPIGELKMPNLDTDPTWNATKRAVKAFVDADVKLPIFGLPTIASVLNIAVNLYGQEILVEMIADPDNALLDLQTITDLQCTLHEWCISQLPAQQLQCVLPWERFQPPGYGQLCGCTCQLISGELYGELIAPLDDRLLGVYPKGGMIHLCGSHTQHIEPFRNMPHLRSVQFNDRATWDLKEYYDKLRPDQILYLMPSDEMTVEKAMEITGGDRLIIQAAHFEVTSPIKKGEKTT